MRGLAWPLGVVLSCASCGVPSEAPDSSVPRCSSGGAALGPYGIVVDPSGVYTTMPDGLGTIWRQPLAGGDPMAFAELGGFPRAMTEAGDALYVAGGCKGDVWRVPLDGGQPTVLAHAGPGDICVHGVAADVASVYFTTGAVDEVGRAGGSPTELVPAAANAGGCLGSIAVSGGDLYWVNPCSMIDAALPALSMMPAARDAVVVVDPGPSAGDAIAIDGFTVYWAAGGSIRARALAGGAVTQVAALAPGDTVFGLASDGSNIYWTTADALWRAAAKGGTPRMLTSIAAPAGVALDASFVYWGGGDLCPAGRLAK